MTSPKPFSKATTGSRRVGVGREAAYGQMRSAEQCQEPEGVLREVPAESLLLVGLDDEQCDGGDERGEPEQEQLGVAPVRQGGTTVTGA